MLNAYPFYNPLLRVHRHCGSVWVVGVHRGRVNVAEILGWHPVHGSCIIFYHLVSCTEVAKDPQKDRFRHLQGIEILYRNPVSRFWARILRRSRNVRGIWGDCTSKTSMFCTDFFLQILRRIFNLYLIFLDVTFFSCGSSICFCSGCVFAQILMGSLLRGALALAFPALSRQTRETNYVHSICIYHYPFH